MRAAYRVSGLWRTDPPDGWRAPTARPERRPLDGGLDGGHLTAGMISGVSLVQRPALDWRTAKAVPAEGHLNVGRPSADRPCLQGPGFVIFDSHAVSGLGPGGLQRLDSSTAS